MPYIHVPFRGNGILWHAAGINDTLEAIEQFAGMRSDLLEGFTCTKGQNNLTICGSTPCSRTIKKVYRNPRRYYTPEVRAELRRVYNASPKPIPRNCDTAVHVRRGDARYGNPRRTSDEQVENTLQHFTRKYGANQSICIFSEGVESDFNAFNLTRRFPHTRLYLNGGIREAFHSLVVAPRLVMARSSFSYAAALLNTEQIFYYKMAWMSKPLDHWQRLN